MIERTSRGLAGVMFEELDALKSGSSTPQMARSKAAVANTICTISRLEMDFARFVAGQRADSEDKNKLGSLPMGAIEA